MKSRFVFWDVLPCKIIVNVDVSEVHVASIIRAMRLKEKECINCVRQHVPLKRRLTIILHGSTSQRAMVHRSQGAGASGSTPHGALLLVTVYFPGSCGTNMDHKKSTRKKWRRL
jgi:hypothetical protein